MATTHGVEMTADFMSNVRAEIEALEAELAGNTIYRKIKALRAALREYELGESPRRSSTGMGSGKTVAMERRSPVRRTSPEREQAVEFVRNYINDRTSPTPIRELFDAMLRAGIELGGKNPINNLSAILSMNDEFVSHGRSGWVLAANDPLKDVEVDVELGLRHDTENRHDEGKGTDMT